ncbi:acyl-CoA thioesterase [Kordiimonas aquimaris]|uniref:acyl-CoA thioesterase n=1 Tax=Kordiimonas aquimaris TaxID=707591 RepID=UPI00374D1C93
MKQETRSRKVYGYKQTIPTRWMDNDVYGHVNNVNYYSFFDTAVNQFLINKGILDIHAGETIGLVVETGCRYHASITFPQSVLACVAVSHIGKSSVRYEIGLFIDEQQEAAAEGFFVHVYVDRETRRPTSIPETMRAQLEAIALSV